MNWLSVILCILLLSACAPQAEPEAVSLLPVFCPGEPCETALVQALKSAEESVGCAFFDLGLESVAEELERKAKEIPVRLVLDREHSHLFPAVSTRNYSGSAYMHNKFCVIDSSLVATGSFNPTENGAERNDNLLILLRSRSLAQSYAREFEEMWDGEFGGGGGEGGRKEAERVVEAYFCPEDQCAARVRHELLKAKESVAFLLFSFTDEEVADALLMAGARVEGVSEKLQAGGEYSQVGRLREFGIDVLPDSNPGMMHHKTFIIDSKIVVTGSYNPTGNGNTKNDENILIIRDERVAERFLEEFARVRREAAS